MVSIKFNLYFILFCGIISISVGCSRMMYKEDTRTYDYNEAYRKAEILKKGTLIVSVPTYARKIELLEKVIAKNPDDLKNIKKLEVEKTRALNARVEFIKYFNDLYSFSKFILVEDTLVRNLLKGEKINLNLVHKLDDAASMQISVDSTYFICKQGRFTDDLYITSYDNSVIPAPFPINSTTGTLDIGDLPWHKFSEEAKRSVIAQAVLGLDTKLKKFIAKL